MTGRATDFRLKPMPSTTERFRFSAIDAARGIARKARMPTCFVTPTSPENSLGETIFEPPAAEIDAFGGGDDPRHSPARNHYGRRRPVQAEPVARLHRRRHREGLRLSG